MVEPIKPPGKDYDKRDHMLIELVLDGKRWTFAFPMTEDLREPDNVERLELFAKDLAYCAMDTYKEETGIYAAQGI